MSLRRYLVNPDRVSHIEGLNPAFSGALGQLYGAAPPEIRNNLQILSGHRDIDHQKRLFDAAVKKYGSVSAARKWVAPPGKSQHNHGHAVDFRYGNDAARDWTHTNAEKFGLNFPMSHEPWHAEMAGARTGGREDRNRGAQVPPAELPAPSQPTNIPVSPNMPRPTNVPAAPVFQGARRPNVSFGDLLGGVLEQAREREMLVKPGRMGGGAVIPPSEDPFFIG